MSEEALSSPSHGRTIKNSIKYWADKLINVRFDLIKNAQRMRIHNDIIKFYMDYLTPKIPVLERETPNENMIELMANAALSTWLMAVSTGNLSTKSTLYDSLIWFVDSENELNYYALKDWLSTVDITPLQELRYDNGFLDLYPYILELFETNNELFLKGSQRLKKRRYGIFYTPSDVAHYMVKNIMNHGGYDIAPSTWIDPACGTGIFLRAIIEYHLDRKIVSKDFFSLINFFMNYIYGIDISKSAVQSSTFTILTYFLSKTNDKLQRPWVYWQKIRGNIVTFDSTKIESNIEYANNNSFRKERMKAKYDFLLYDKRNLALNPKGLHSIKDIFPEIKDGFTYLVTNPPYSKIDSVQTTVWGDKNNSVISSHYPLFLDFIKMMWKFCNPNKRACSMVVPLSITYNSEKPFINIRKEILKIKGDWYFANFDRTPDSLFGDDVKTRNTIIFHFCNKQNKEDVLSVYTTSLLRWNSRKRARLFENINFTKLKNYEISQYIPKIGNELERDVFYTLLKNFKPHIKIDFSKEGKKKKYHLYSGKTAYNWLPIYLVNPYSKFQPPTRHSTLEVMNFREEEEALLIFGLLSSRISYWLWRIMGDGFHLTKRFISQLPINVYFSPKEKDAIINSAVELWNIISKRPIVTKNSGVISISYYPYSAEKQIDDIDKIILNHFGFSQTHVLYFKNFVRNIIIAGREELGSNSSILIEEGNK